MSLDERFLKAGRAYERLERAQIRELLNNYQTALREIRAEIALAYEKYDGSYAEMVKYNRLSNLERDIGQEISTLTGKNAVGLKKGIGRAFSESYYQVGFILETELVARLGFGQLSRDTIEAIINNPLDRVGFLQRNRDNQARLTRQLRERLTQGLIQGKSYAQVARDIKERMNVGATNVMRITQTEMHRAHIEGNLKAFQQAESAGVEVDRIWVATLDQNTRDTHQAMDGEKANEEGLFELGGLMVRGPGLTGIPEEDIRCRCAVRVEIAGYGPKVRRARDAESGRGELIQHTTYNQWKAARIGA